ncbi:MAG: anthranilate synthase/aminodeoxychorismate synthase-like glutamine amidotransferase [Planctomycetota bacterium]|jgi:anthranilate synthase/aminodeoxychorismate synthase-like glutamine amidotransferase
MNRLAHASKSSTRPRVLLLDHRDSFVYLLADQIARLGVDIDVVRAGMSLVEWQDCVARMNPSLVVLSPGPGHAKDAVLARAWLATRPTTPVFGVCLGHQVIGLAAGEAIERADEPVHGEACTVTWCQQPFATALPEEMSVARYHSLLVVRGERVTPLRTLATTRSHGRDLVMAIEHTELPQLGVQFHPESVLTPHGQQLLRGVMTWSEQKQKSMQMEEVIR